MIIGELWQKTEKREIECLREYNKELSQVLKNTLKYFRCVEIDEHNNICGVNFSCSMCREAKNVQTVIDKLGGKLS